MNNALYFFREFIKHPTKVGAIVPSSEHLAEEMMRQAHVSECQYLAEFGAGTGVFTKKALKTLPEGSKFISIEQNEQLVKVLRHELSEEHNLTPKPVWCNYYKKPPIYCDTVENLPKMMKEANIAHLDSIISGLPWAAFGDDLQNRLLQVAIDSLKPGGYFVTFAYLQGLLLPAGQQFSKKIKQRFHSVKRSQIVWKNIPPAFVYCCRKCDE